MSEKIEMSEEDYLKKHIEETEKSVISAPKSQSKEFSRTEELQFFNFDVKDLPCGKFYTNGTMFAVRAAQVKEIQAYSMVDDNNYYDMIEKMNDMLQSCIRVKHANGEVGSFLDIKDPDRFYLIFLLRELTFEQGNMLSVNKKCTCGTENQLELKRENFKLILNNPLLDKYFVKNRNSFIFKLTNNEEFELAPPTIGIQKSFASYILRENNEGRPPELSFLKIIPFMLPGQTSISYEGIKSKLTEFQKMSEISFQFLNDVVSKMTFGIECISKQCVSCGMEVRSDMQFPNGASGIFVIHNAFEAFIKK